MSCIVVILLGFSVLCSAQQEQQNSQYMLSKYRINPAYAGLDYSLSIDAMIRSQYTGIAGQPRTQYLSGHIPAYFINGAIGFELYRATEGTFQHTSATGSYNYVHNLPFGFLSTGLRLGVLQTDIDGSELRSQSGDYTSNAFNHNDPLLENTTFSGLTPIWELGVYLYMGKPQFGVSISRTPTLKQTIGNAEISLVSHIDAFMEYSMDYSENIQILPSILLKSDFNIVQTDVSIIAEINGNVFGGVGVRGYNSSSIDAFTIMTGMNLGRNYRLSYSYDVGLSELKRVNEGSHEILLNYNLKKLIGQGSNPKVEYNPRNL